MVLLNDGLNCVNFVFGKNKVTETFASLNLAID